MAVVNRKGQAVTNVQAKPVVITPSFIGGGDLDSLIDFVQAINGDSAGSVYELLQIPSNARLNDLKIQCDALGAGAKVDVGVYYPDSMPDNPSLAGTAISTNFFAAALDVSAALPKTDILNQSGTNTIALQNQTLAQALGLNLNGLLGSAGADPQVRLVICATVHAASPIAATGNLGMSASFVD